MNILFICDEYPPGRNGGIGTMIQVLSRELVRQGNNVFVAGLYAHSYGQSNYEEDHGVKVWRFRYGWNLHVKSTNILHKIFNKIPGLVKQHLNGRKAFNRYIQFINELIDREEINIIEIPDWNTFAMRIGFIVKWPAFKVPLVLKSHGSYSYFASEMNTPAKRNLKEIDLELYKRADALTAVSRYTAIKNKELFSITKKIDVLYNAIEPSKTGIIKNKEQFKVIFTGTLIEKKGIFQLMKAWNVVNVSYPNAILEIYGKGDQNQLKEFLNQNALNSVHFKGHIYRELLLKVLSTATLAIFPSYSETFGLAVVEAMSVGCPVIFTRRSCGPEIVNEGVDGFLVDPDNISEIAEKIITLLRDKQLQKRFSEKAQETVIKRFNISDSVKHHLVYYTDIIDRQNK